ncbi:unnamed protein product [Cylicocyclus nassatus]|uniref:Serine carboxypeptidase n=1 Tax=Cylicocyclus nassatus TaxID=53992 RepID=A0AA36MFX2_CYLNA|nr:unnamed protein product [Cylicocyclus nassatus]
MRLPTLLVLSFVLDVATGNRTAQATTDRVRNLPGVSFETRFEQFAGYLNSTDDSGPYQLHYWYIESQTSPATDPLILYISGVQCSSAYAMMMNIGPFRSYGEGKPLYENVFSWNKVANLLVIDPPGIGYSFNPNEELSDETIATVIENALTNFITMYPERANNTLYLAGEGYASVYVTKIAYIILEKLKLGRSQMNLQGLSIGNGMLSAQTELNTIVPMAYTHGFAGKE